MSSTSMRKKMMFFSKLKFPCRLSGRHAKESNSSVVHETDVNEEYKEAFRTKSYIEICNKVQSQLGNKRVEVGPTTSSSSSSRDQCIHLCDLLLEPQPEALVDLTNAASGLHHLLVDYFEAGLEAGEICEKLLQSVHQASRNHLKIKRVIKLGQRTRDGQDQCAAIFEELDSYSLLKNPLSDFSPGKFPNINKHQSMLLKRLKSKCTITRRKRKLIICLKVVGGCTLVVGYTVLVVALIVLVCHSVVGMVASPGLIACSFSLLKEKRKSAKKKLKTSELKRLGEQLDVAAKGIYTLIKDFDTMAWLVGRLYDEIEFGKAMASKCVRNQKHDVLEEVVREFRIHESCFLEQLEELEDHIYLCLLNLNRSRRLLVEELRP